MDALDWLLRLRAERRALDWHVETDRFRSDTIEATWVATAV